MMELQMLGILLNFYRILIKYQLPQFGFLVQVWGAMSQISLIVSECVSVYFKAWSCHAYVINLLIYNFVTLLYRFIKSFP